jgi:hypothetical protein
MTELLIAVTPKPGQVQDLRPGGALTDKLQDRIGEISDAIHRIGYDLRDKLDDMLVPASSPGGATSARAPASQSAQGLLSEIEVSFSLELQAGAGVIVAAGSATAGIEVSLTWSRKRD